MRQGNAGDKRGKTVEGLIQVARPAPKVLHADQVQDMPVPNDLDCLVVEDLDPPNSQAPSHRAVKVAMTSEAQGVSNGEIMVAQYREHSLGAESRPSVSATRSMYLNPW